MSLAKRADDRLPCAFTPGMRVARMACRDIADSIECVSFDLVKSVRRHGHRSKVTLESGAEFDQGGRPYKRRPWARNDPHIEPATEQHVERAAREKKLIAVANAIHRISLKAIARFDEATVDALLALVPRIGAARKEVE